MRLFRATGRGTLRISSPGKRSATGDVELKLRASRFPGAAPDAPCPGYRLVESGEPIALVSEAPPGTLNSSFVPVVSRRRRLTRLFRATGWWDALNP
ncbi:hypothetical protein [Klebsiella aerogenes]|uniref:hypothetical protein n=1 Tax=Klebsiella aerogenes TaxID=548 RepID=UPI00131EEDA7|nr:hypothetical protein [Klebsiella aerogenes]MCA4049551.1 hypothetical protein [Klebsiella aerogenes]